MTAASQSFVLTVSAAPSPSSSSFATAISSNKRYIVDQSDNPWLMTGDSVWSLMSQLSTAQMETYFAERKSLGFNCALVSVLSTPYSGMNSNANADNFATYDGVTPFTAAVGSANWLSTPNATYFNRLVAMVELAATYGITVMLDPYETGWNVEQQPGNTTSNTVATCTAYGIYLGNLLKTQPNVIWSSGDDYGSYVAYDEYVLAIAKGIASVVPNQLQSVELLDESSSNAAAPNLSTDDANWPNAFPNTLINCAYTYWSSYDLIRRGYNRTPVVPVFGGEFDYEGNNNADQSPAPDLQSYRGQFYWTMTNGGCGGLYGNGTLWFFGDGLSDLSTSGAIQFGYLASLFTSLDWWKLVPDQNNTFLTAGEGTPGGQDANPAADDYATGTVSADGTVGLVYTPFATTLTIDMAKMSAETAARWFDPTAGTYTAIDTYANTGTHQFTTPGNHSDESADWVLVLTA